MGLVERINIVEREKKMDYTRIDGNLSFAEGYRDGDTVIVSVIAQGCADNIFTLDTKESIESVLIQELEKFGL